MRLTNKELGQLGEDFAAQWFLARGFLVLDKNWRANRVELDLVVSKCELIVFVEVKTRSSYDFGGAIQAISPQKLKNLKLAALLWLTTHKTLAPKIRIDLLALQYDGDNFQVTHIPGVS